jgi:DNA repair protein RadC
MKESSGAYRITDIDEAERPRERLARLGPQALSRAELLAILLRVGVEGKNAIEVGEELIQKFGGIYGIHRASLAELCECPGIGLAKAAQIKAAIELGRRLTSESPEERQVIQSPESAADLLQIELSALDHEELWVILLDVRNRLIKKDMIYKGSLTSSQVRIGELFKLAVQLNAAHIIVAHNHPSGDPTPSPEDIAITRSIVQAGKLMDIEVLDHLIIGGMKFVSLKQRGLGF